MKKLFLLFVLSFALNACVAGGVSVSPDAEGKPINYFDGTWARCELEYKGVKFWRNIQNAPPAGVVLKDGTVISCELIPPVRAPVVVK